MPGKESPYRELSGVPDLARKQWTRSNECTGKNIETGEIETISLPAHESQHVLGPPDHISGGSLDTLNCLCM